VEKKMVLTVAFVLMLLFSAVFGIEFVSLAKGNPFSQSAYSGERPPSVRVNPPEVSVISPQNNRTYATADILLSFNASTKGSQHISAGSFHYLSSIGITEVYFTADWLLNKTIIYRAPRIEEWIDNTAKFFFMGEWYDKHEDLPEIDFEKLSLTLTDVPDGNHTICLYAVGSGSEYYIFNWYRFYVTGFSKVHFVVDTTPPTVKILQIANKTLDDSEVPLNFTVSESVSRISYVLDGQDNSTLYENITLTELPNGEHNLTVYAWDDAGNIGASETVTFTVAKPEPLPTALVITPMASVAVIGVGLVYFKRHKH
jgi:hypothetical protein